jgi:hypothetical protein
MDSARLDSPWWIKRTASQIDGSPVNGMTYIPRGQWDWYRREAYSREMADRERWLREVATEVDLRGGALFGGGTSGVSALKRPDPEPEPELEPEKEDVKNIALVEWLLYNSDSWRVTNRLTQTVPLGQLKVRFHLLIYYTTLPTPWRLTLLGKNTRHLTVLLSAVPSRVSQPVWLSPFLLHSPHSVIGQHIVLYLPISRLSG